MDINFELKRVLESKGLNANSNLDSLDSLLPLIELVRQDGSIFVIKVDGEREPGVDAPPYTVFASGKKVPGGIVRCDSSDLLDSVKQVLVKYANAFWFKS